jgi:hypothetical protein
MGTRWERHRRGRTILWTIEVLVALTYGLHLGVDATSGMPTPFVSEPVSTTSTALCPDDVVAGSVDGPGPGRYSYIPAVDAAGEPCWVMHDGGVASP